MTVDLEISPSEALDILEEQRERLAVFGERLLVGNARLEGERPLKLSLNSRGVRYRDDGTAEEERYKPKLRLAYAIPASSHERPQIFQRGQLRGGTYTRGSRTVHVPERKEVVRYDVGVNRIATIGLMAVYLQQEQETGTPYRHRVPISNVETQLMLGDTYTLIAIAHGLDPAKIS